ncbi:MAG TPA: Clp protease N-terminal domain-containing protein [Vicinamibacterales bacterium]
MDTNHERIDLENRMFDRFTLQALQVLFYARSEVSQLGSSAVEPEHLLLGVLDESTGFGSKILARIGDTLDDLRSDIIRRLTSGEKVPESQEIPFSASTVRALQYAGEEADRLLHKGIGTEHLLLGLLREERSIAAEVLTARGLSLEAVREAIVERLISGEEPEPPGPPPTPASTYQWPQIPFVPSRTVHILYSGMQWPEGPVINGPVINNHADTVFSAYGFTLEDIIVRAWKGNRWHVDIAPALRDDARFDFLMVLPQHETWATCLGLLQSAIEQHFAVHVKPERGMRDVFVLTKTDARGHMLRRYPDPERGTAFSSIAFSVFMGRSKDAPMFPLDAFAVHSVPFMLLVNWFEEILGGQVIDETGSIGIYGFELKERVKTPEALIRLLRDEAGLVITQERREISTLIVRQREAAHENA